MTKKKQINSGFSLNNLLGDLEDSDTRAIQQDLITNSLENNEEPSQLPEEDFSGRTSDLILHSAKTESLQEQELESGFYLLDLKTKAVYSIMKNTVTVGCSGECDLIVENALVPHTVSRKHAVIEIEGGTAYITDTSSHGIFFAVIENNKVEFKKIPRGERVLLKKGCIFKLAAKSFKFIAP